jgi:hypothetical protein
MLPKVLSFTVAASLCGLGLWLLVVKFLWSTGVWARGLALAVSLILFGGYWLWIDFITPALGIRAAE